ncbi:tyrosyl-DNA phosphodiesterase 2-like [Bradysia coprophila]|uniref:tyrosyl-DNA phosphodiesterase 2-like n=1 Tax=Bradysia coprophila TaxID=38358 RepID=UPI00187DB9A6|nr:tyrosyl-DNA phosphodiesterase 2-like [Bradysia coprophila]
MATNRTTAEEVTFSRSPAKLSVISWNLDGLDSNNLAERTAEVVALLEKRDYTVVMLQELILPTFQYIAAKLKSKYKPVVGTHKPESTYFTVTFLRTNRVIYVDHEIVNFPGSMMDRNLLITRCRIDRVNVAICNTHLESTAAFAPQRVIQLKMCFDRCRSIPPEWNVIFGGDLNARDTEVQGKVPANMHDLWMRNGSSSSKFTWDLKYNTNKQMPGKVQPRCRFDRLFFRESVPATLTPEFFGLTGLSKVAGTNSFPSDHWGVVAFFQET